MTDIFFMNFFIFFMQQQRCFQEVSGQIQAKSVGSKGEGKRKEQRIREQGEKR